LKKKKKGIPYQPLVRRTLFLLTSLFGVLLLFLSAPAAAGGIWIVAHQDVEVATLTRTETANLFLAKGRTDSQLTPFDQRDRQLRERFYREVAGVSAASVRAHWAKQVFTGRGRPPAMLSLEEVERVLSEKPGAVTYVPAGQLPEGSKVLLSIGAGE
jgi:hypothetical protein